MTRCKLFAISVTAACILAALLAAVAPAVEFVKTGNKITTEGEGAAILLPEADIVCTASGTGSIASATEIEVHVKYSGCNASLGTKTKAEAKISECNSVLTAAGKLTLVKGCTIEASGCVIEQPAAENKEREGVGYGNLKTEGELELEVNLDARGLTYKVNKTCEEFGLAIGKEGALDEDIVAQNANVQGNEPKFWIKNVGTFRTIKIKNVTGTEYEFIFPTNAKFIKCADAHSSGATTTLVERWWVQVGRFTYATCKTNMFAGEPAVTMTATECWSAVWLSRGPAGPPQPGGTTWLELPACTLEVKVSLCVISFRPIAPHVSLGSEYKNTAGSNPKTVTVEQSGAGGGPNVLIPYVANSGCNGVTPLVGSAIYRGKSLLTAETDTGGAADIEVKGT